MSQNPFGENLNIPRFEPPKVPPGVLRIIVPLALVLFLGVSSFFQIEPEEVGVVTRFGAHVRDTEPGLHLKLPIGIEKVYKVPARREINVEFGFRSPGVNSAANNGRPGGRVDPRHESNMLTGDLNAAVVEWVVQYRIAKPFDYLFQVRDVDETFRDMSEAVMREVVGDRTVNDVLTTGRRDVADEALDKLNALCLDYQTGIHVERVVLQDVTPPESVKPAFNDVNQAQQDRERLINEAQSEYNKVIPRTRGEAQQTIAAAQGYAVDRVNRSQGEAARFESLFAEYRKAPAVTRQRMYLETLGEVLPQVGRKIVIDKDVEGLTPLLDLRSAAGAVTRPPASAGGGGR